MFPSILFGNEQGGLVFVNPVPPLGIIFSCQLWPLSFSSKAVCSYNSQSLTVFRHPPQLSRLYNYEEIKIVNTISNDVIINGQIFVKCLSNSIATIIAQLIKDLVPLDEKAREETITNTIKKMFDIDEINKILAEYRRRTDVLYFFCNALWIYLFMLTPIAVWKLSLAKIIMPLIVGLLLFHLPILIIYYSAHKFLYLKNKEDRLINMAKMSLFPPMSIRALDALSRNLFDIYHPLAVLNVLSPGKKFFKFAKQVILDLRFPILSDIVSESMQAVENSFRKKVAVVLIDLLRRNGIDENELTKPKFLPNSSFVSFCPRCHTEYTVASGECADCPGIYLVPKDQVNRR